MTWTVPQFMVDIAADYAESSGDFLANPAVAPLWFKSILAAEYFLQLPFFVYALIAWLRSWNAPGLRAACIAYGAHVATTLVPIMAEFYFATSLSSEQRVFLLSIYSPYLILPLAIMARAGGRPVLFPGKSKAA